MNPQEPSHASVPDVLRRAGAVHSRQRATLFLLRSALWLVVAIPLLLVADVLFHFSDTLRLAGVIGLVLAGSPLSRWPCFSRSSFTRRCCGSRGCWNREIPRWVPNW